MKIFVWNICLLALFNFGIIGKNFDQISPLSYAFFIRHSKTANTLFLDNILANNDDENDEEEEDDNEENNHEEDDGSNIRIFLLQCGSL